MSNVIHFPRTAAGIPAAPILREQFERLAGLALDVVDQIVLLLDEADDNPDAMDVENQPAEAVRQHHHDNFTADRGGESRS
ncbi:hypothetical protein [Methylobacterium ajmalii]|uniref:hypothetical protein n=1 Tax=Methylobacterium ajmalii TaxID=2738439 RepID=UPI000A783E34|nr:hypothetical protein [Methylobacterium ajmalii]MBK3397640.1 hypothetical protein [Methylobacterium ajmalii]MBK3426760.1 hypothetical protein [Methylobacterium ajmalii]MBZ6415363.1 hypothetical protein [Methylobacterium sp.]